MTEKLLIIGCGDIGQRLALAIAPLGYTVTGLRRSAAENLPYLRYWQGDVSKPEQLSPLLAQGFDVIVISMTPTQSDDEGYRRAYVESCQQLMAGLDQQIQKPRLILFVSSTSVYAQNDGSWVDENSPTHPEGFAGKRLLEAEQIIMQSDYPSTIVRFSGIYGPGRHRLINQVINQRASASSGYTNRIHADDCAGALAHLIELAKSQPLAPLYLASDCEPTPMIEVVSWIAKQLKVNAFLASEVVNERGSKRIANTRLLNSGFRFCYPDFKAGYTAVLEGFSR
jgi:nucleoside-diphosphate-sugar epimerase